MGNSINGKKVAFLATNGFEQSELLETKRLIEEAGAQTTIVAPEAGQIRAWKDKDWGDTIRVDQTLDQSKPDQFDALVIPGGVISSDELRTDRRAVNFVRRFAEQGKVIGAICHGPWLLVEADIAQDHRITSWPSLKTDLENAGAIWQDKEVICDTGIVTSRKPVDIPAFSRKLVEEIAEPSHKDRMFKAVSFI